MRLQVRDVMTETVISIRPDAPIREAADAMLLHDVSGLPVVDRAGTVIGIVTEGDFVSREARPDRPKKAFLPFLRGSDRAPGFAQTIEDVMTKDVLTATPGEEVRAAARRMTRSGVNRLPVLDHGKLVGIVSRHDVLEVFDRSDDELGAAVKRFLEENLFVPPDANIKVHVDDGVVALTGQVRYEGDVRVAASLAGSVDGVTGVRNSLSFVRPDLEATTHGPVAFT